MKITTTIIYFEKKLLMNYLNNKFLYKIETIYYDRIYVSEGTQVNKTSE